jgi:hypothetical protein
MNHKAEYDTIKLKIVELNEALKNRCIECSNFNKKKGECIKHGFVPVEYVYQRNDCPEYDFCPF